MENLLFFKFAREFFALCIGILFGIVFSYFIKHSSEEHFRWLPIPRLEGDVAYRRDLMDVWGLEKHKQDEEYHKFENSTVAQELVKKIKILCLIMTVPENHEKRAMRIKNTWGRRCTNLLFISTKNDTSLPTIPIFENENIGWYSWKQTQIAYKYVLEYYSDEVDWILKCDDFTYVVLENLRYSLASQDPLEPFYFGVDKCFALSKEAVKKFVNIALLNSSLCNFQYTGFDYVIIKSCLGNVGVEFLDSREIDGRDRFFRDIKKLFIKSDFQYSSSGVFFSHLDNTQFYSLEYLIYHLRPYGISYNFSLPKIKKKTISSILSNIIKNNILNLK